MTVQAKVRCIANSNPPWSDDGNDTVRIVRFTPVWDPDPASPNFVWSQATPSGYVELTITVGSAFGEFVPGEEYVLSFDAT